MPRKPSHRGYAGEVGKAYIYSGILVPLDIARNPHGLVIQCLFEVGLEAVRLIGAKIEQLGKLLHDLIGVLEAIGQEIDHEDRFVAGEGDARAIKQQSAPRRDQAQLKPIALGEQLPFLVFGDRKPSEPACQHTAETELQRAQDSGPARKLLLQYPFVCWQFRHRLLLIAGFPVLIARPDRLLVRAGLPGRHLIRINRRGARLVITRTSPTAKFRTNGCCLSQ